MTLKKIPPQKFNHQPDECLDVMMYTLELSRPCTCTCKDERGKNDLWPSACLYLYNYICTLFEIFFLLFRMYSTWSGCFLHLLRDIHLCILYHPFTIHPHGLWLRWNLIQIIPIRSVPRVDSSPQPPTGALKLLNESTSSSVNYCQKWW